MEYGQTLCKIKRARTTVIYYKYQKIIEFFETKFEDTDTMKNLCKVLKLWEEITPFMIITKIEDVNIYRKKLDEWEEKLNEFYEVGGKNILTKNPANPGDDETFYFHVLCFYWPMISKKNLGGK